MESAITSRLTSDALMPSVPIVMPSEIDTVLNSIGVPPAARMPSLDVGGKRAEVEVARTDFDPGVGDADERLAQVGIGKPAPFSMARAGARCAPKVRRIGSVRQSRARPEILGDRFVGSRWTCNWDTSPARAAWARTRPGD